MKFKENYAEFVIDKNLNYLIDDCEEIGIMDPFLEEDDSSCTHVKIPEHVSDFVYPISKLVYTLSPTTIYLPSKKILFKLMRACIEVHDVEHLWFNKKEH